MNLEKIVEWGAIFLVVILGARWLAGLFGTGDPVQSVGPQMQMGYSGYGYSGGYGPWSNGVVYMEPGIVGPGGRGGYGSGRGRRR
jgi:hypothetical protein